MNLSFRSTISRYIPPWLAARGSTGKIKGFKFLYAAALLCDFGIENAYQGLNASFPGVGTREALPLIGSDRLIARGINESDKAYADRLIPWLDDWAGAGNAFTIMRQVRDYCAPSKPKMRVVNDSGTWYTLNPDDTIEIHQTFISGVNWNWDNQAFLFTTRCWLIIYSDAGPWEPDGTWGDGHNWGDGRTWGTSAMVDQVAILRGIVGQFKSAGDKFQNIIVAFDPASFDPTSAPNASGMPDGTWGHWSKVVGGVRVHSRLDTARYFDGV